MRGRKVEDPERPVESYPGYLGFYFDGDYLLEAELKPLLAFPWGEYRDLEVGPALSSKRTIEFSVGTTLSSLTFERDTIDLISFLDQLPTVVVTYDEDGGDLGPASGGVLTVWENEKFSLSEIAQSVKSCLVSLERDFEILKAPSKQE